MQIAAQPNRRASHGAGLRRRIDAALLCTALIASATVAHAQTDDTAVAPPVAEAIAGESGNSIPLGRLASGTYQVMYDPSALRDIPRGSLITGLRLRLFNAASTSWPPSPVTLTRFEIRMSQTARDLDTMSAVFSANLLNPVLVRSTPLSLAAGAYPGTAAADATPEPWGPLIAFDRPFVFGGGLTVLEFRVTGTGGREAFFAESTFDPGVGEVRINDGPTGAGASIATLGLPGGPVVRFEFLPPPRPLQQGVTGLIVPAEFATGTGTGLGPARTSVPLSQTPQTAQYLIGESEFGRLGIGSEIVGLNWRVAEGSPWPAATRGVPRLDILLARALTTPSSMNASVSANNGPDATVALSGPRKVGAGSLGPAGRFGAPIPFDLAHMYSGGPLALTIRHAGTAGVGPMLDAAPATPNFLSQRVAGRASPGLPDAAQTQETSPFPTTNLAIDAGTIAPGVLALQQGDGALGFPFISNPVTVQWIIHASELRHIPIGSQITGYALRASSTGFPAFPTLFGIYDVTMSTATRTPLAPSRTFALNDGPDRVLVRSGPLAFVPGDFPGGSEPNPPGAVIWFDRPFLYTGGNVCITVRHSGIAGMGSVDGTFSVSTTRQITATNPTATLGLINNVGPVIRFSYVPSVVVPREATSNSPGGGLPLLNDPVGQVHQSVFAPEDLRQLRIGSVITGLSLRRSSAFPGESFPQKDRTIERFDVTLSSAPRGPEAMSGVFAENIGSDAVLVRQGALRIPADAFPSRKAGPIADDHAWFIRFERGFVYRGGPLSLTIRTNAALGPETLLDAATEPSTSSAGRWSSGAGADATAENRPDARGALVSRLVFVPRSFCPADLSNDGVVDGTDFVIFAGAYELVSCRDDQMELGCPADLTLDRTVDAEDFAVFARAYADFLCP